MVRVILDVDTGVDDALALAVAVGHPEIRLEAAISVAGNVGLELTTRNTLRVLDWLGARDVPVAAGADRPIDGPLRDASRWHGVDGMGGARLPESTRTAEPDGVGYMIERVLAEPGELTLVCVGPLTNLAQAIQRRPEIVSAVREVVVMGGAARPPGNVTPVAEFNIHADPRAAAMVFGQPWRMTMVGLDVTTRVRLTRADRDLLAGQDSAEAELVREVTRQQLEERSMEAIALHDPLAVMVALDPGLVSGEETYVEVETRGEHTLGQTVADLRATREAREPPTLVCLDVDVARARSLFFETLRLSR